MKCTDSLSLQLLILCFALSSSSLVAQNSNEPIDPNYWYLITNMWKGEGLALSVVTDNQCNCQLQLVQPQKKAFGQYWRFTPVKDGWYRVSTKMYKKVRSLDILNDGKNNRPQLADRGKITGQLWRIVPAPDGSFQLYSMWQKENKVLDVMNDGKNTVLLGDKKGYSGQFWKFTPIRPIQSKQQQANGNIAPNKAKSNPSKKANNSWVNQSGRGRSRTGPNKSARTNEQDPKRVKEEAQINFLQAEETQQFKTEEVARVANPENTLRKGTQLVVSNPPANWEQLSQPIELKVVKAVVVNGNILLRAGQIVHAEVTNSETHRFGANNIDIQLVGIKMDSKIVPIRTGKVTTIGTEPTDDFNYISGDVNFEVPIETGISIDLQEDVIVR